MSKGTNENKLLFLSPVKTNLFVYIFTYLFISSIIICNIQCTLYSISFLKAKRFSFSGLFQNPNFCHVKCLCQILFMLTRYLNASWPLLPITLGSAMNERQRLRTYQLPCVQDISSHRFSYLNSDKFTVISVFVWLKLVDIEHNSQVSCC